MTLLTEHVQMRGGENRCSCSTLVLDVKDSCLRSDSAGKSRGFAAIRTRSSASPELSNQTITIHPKEGYKDVEGSGKQDA